MNIGALSTRFKSDLKYNLTVIRKRKILYVFMAPYAILFFVFTLLPVITAIFLSFTSFNLLEAPKWVGLNNYYKLFLQDDIFITALKNTLLFAVILGPGGYIISFFFAWLINELSTPMRVFFTIIFYAPSLAGGMLTIFTFFFSGDQTAYFNGMLLKLGLISEPIAFFQNTKYIIPLLIVVSLWMSLGTSFLSFIAGFQGVEPQYYEAAAIDGIKNRWQELWFITLPLLKPQLVFGAIISITGAFTVGSVTDALCGFPSPDYVAHTLINHMNDYGNIRYEMGYANAIATVLLFMMIVSNIFIQKLIRRVGL